ncbi:MAG: M23 family metallopeptidase, partial [Candidatus Latescibacteria bacterium]|nr:M23 family metallopeptidase [Candidatus Latescibacterota bacterium]
MGVRVATISRRSRSGQSGSIEMRWVPSIWPVSPSIGWVTRGFESSHGVFKNRHLGIDIAAAEGAPVQATADGRVVFADVDDVLGHLVAIDHGGGYMTRYGHNSALLVHEGEHVRQGQHIALVGSSGRSSGPHLHYEVIEDGRVRNPRNFLSQE